MAKLIASRNLELEEQLERQVTRHPSPRVLTLVRRGFYGVCLGLLLCGTTAWAQSGHEEGKAQPSRAFNPVYPYEALIAGRGGWAEISFTVDYSGHAIFTSTVSASEPAYAHALIADIESIEFITPRLNGHPVVSLDKERYNFPAEPEVDAVGREILAELRKPVPALIPVAELDSKPVPIRQPLPAYPWVLRGEGTSGQAEIEFVIDRNGRTLFPRIVSATHEDFGWAAATAVLQWRYKSPLKNGAKVDTRVTEKIVFDINKAAGMW